MSFEIPAHMEPDVRQYAKSQHITSDEAVVRLIKAGLGLAGSKPANRSILGAFSSPEDVAVMDDALEFAMQERERRNASPNKHA